MKRLIFAMALTAASQIASAAKISSVDELIGRLSDLERYDASATYSVLLPSAAEDIVYTIDLQSISCPADSLSECDYLIEWSLPTPSGISSGFSSYNDGAHFRYRDQRLQEYHFDWDSIPFIAGGGVQRNAQFVDILPNYLAKQLRKMTANPDYEIKFTPAAVFNGRHALRIDATETVSGYTAREITYLFDNETALPLRLEFENNPGAISEQTVSVEYDAPRKQPLPIFSEDMLMQLYPDIFERLRQSNFRIENLPGTDLPPFSLPTLTGERYTHSRGDKFLSPVIVALLDPSVASNAETISAIRGSISMLPFSVDVIWVFTGSNIDQVEQLVGQPVIGETTLISGKSLARDTGATSFPVLIFVSRDGVVGDVQLGYNKSLPEIVIQKTSLLDN